VARLLREKIARLEEDIKCMEETLSDWVKVGKAILKSSSYKERSKELKGTRFFMLMSSILINEQVDYMKMKLDDALFGPTLRKQNKK
jgi:hypothetical protein